MDKFSLNYLQECCFQSVYLLRLHLLGIPTHLLLRYKVGKNNYCLIQVFYSFFSLLFFLLLLLSSRIILMLFCVYCCFYFFFHSFLLSLPVGSIVLPWCCYGFKNLKVPEQSRGMKTNQSK